MSVKWEIIEGNKGRLTGQGWEVERVAVVSGVEGLGYQKIWQAFLELNLSIGDSHPDFNSAYLYDFVGASVSADIVKFVLKYRERGNVSNIKVEVTGALRQVESNMDRNGNIITVSHGTTTQGALVPKMKPEGTIVVRIREGIPPYAGIATYVGTINDGDFYVAGDSEKWMCMSITGASDDGIFWDNVYTFQYNKDGWSERVVYIDPATGKPPPNLVEDTGYKDIDMYDAVDFSSLSFSF